MTMESLGVMEHLAATGPLTVMEAARHLGGSQAATSEIVARLETRGPLVRYPDERDRRRHLVWLTPEGLSEWRRANRVLGASMLSEALAQLSSDRRKNLLRSLDQPLETNPSNGNRK